MYGKHPVLFITNKLHLVSVDNLQSIMEPTRLNILLLLLLLLSTAKGLYPVAVCYNTRQDNMIQ